MKKNILRIGSILLVLPFIFQLAAKIKNRRALRKRVLADGNSDYKGTATDIANGINGNTRKLYKELITKIHPDRFLDDKKIIANELSQKITESKHNHSQLVELKNQVDKFLNEN
jgi:hypothetical protein